MIRSSSSPTQSKSGRVIRPSPAPPDAARLAFKHGRRYPRAIAWFGARSFWGHLWHLAASVIATEDIDSRDWMQPDEPAELTKRVADELGGDGDAVTLTEAIDDDLWIDFIADTGDDVSVSSAVAKMLFATYEVEDPDAPGQTLKLPRGQMLLFGGDTAYPVATELEIHNRVIVPFNHALRTAHDGTRRVLLGIPGNHDWYAGLDGFGRMFRRRRGHVDRMSALPQEEIDQLGQIGHLFRWIEAFRVGKNLVKRPTLPLEGYATVQSASYFALRLAPGLDLWGADRQLRAVDVHQAAFFGAARDHEERGLMLILADPAYAFLEESSLGQEILRALDVSVEGDKLLVLSGDTHQYVRQSFGEGVHVTAGGGGAFLHPARIARDASTHKPDAEFPGPRASRALAMRVPIAIALGRSGFLVHIASALLCLPAFSIALAQGRASFWAGFWTGLAAAGVCFAIGGWRRDRVVRIAALSLAMGAVFGAVPEAMIAASERITHALHGGRVAQALALIAPYTLAAYAGALLFGSYLTVLTLLGLEMHQAFAALAHPGYKHFVRMRVHKDGTRVDAFVLGKVDPLRKNEPVVLVDRFTWKNPRARRSIVK